MLLAGAAADRYHRVWLLAAIFGGRALCYVIMLLLITHYWQLLVFSALFGLVDYSVVPLVVSLVASFCGTDVVGLGVGILLMWHSLGAAAGSWMGGAAFDAACPDAGGSAEVDCPHASYDTAVVLCLVACALATVVLLVGGSGIGEPLRRRPEETEGKAQQERPTDAP